MNNEKVDWKPEVGKTAWLKSNYAIRLVKIIYLNELRGTVEVQDWTSMFYQVNSGLFPTLEAALSSIRVYDLEGKEVLISRAEPIPVHFSGVCTECGKQMNADTEVEDALAKMARLAYSMDLSHKPEKE